MARSLILILPVAVFIAGLFLFPWDSDAAFATNDAIGYAHDAERRPRHAIVGHHPLAHVGTAALVVPLRALDLDRPGQWAARILSAAGAALLCGLAYLLAGGRSAGRTTALLLLLILTRGFLVELGTGETVIPGAALAALCLVLASRRDAGALTIGASLCVALWWRQDNILILPGVLFLLMTRNRDRTVSPPIVPWLIKVGLVTLAGYGLMFAISDRGETFMEWMLTLLGHEGRSWGTDPGPQLDRLPTYFASLGAAITGVLEGSNVRMHIAIGLSWVALLVIVALAMRGRQPTQRGFLIAILITLLVRFPFYLWFEPQNFEWWVPAMALIMLACASLVSGPCHHPNAARIAIVAALLGVGAVVYCHGENLLWLRERRIAEDSTKLMEWGGSAPPTTYFTLGQVAHQAFHVRSMDHDQDALGVTPESALARLTKIRTEAPDAPIALFFDRFVRDGHPATVIQTQDILSPLLDVMDTSDPTLSIVKREGRITAIGWNLPNRPHK